MSKGIFYSKIVFAACLLSADYIEAGPATPTTRIVNSTSNDPNTIGTLPYWLLNSNSGDTIDCNAISGQTITLTTSLPAIIANTTINGAGITIDGVSNYQAFQVASGTVAINNVNVQNALSKGGDGGAGYAGGGGGVGGGGALYIHGGTSVTLAASSLINNIAKGGDGGLATFTGNAGGGGGGGFGGGTGGNSFLSVSTGGGGGGYSNGGNGGGDSPKDGSNGVYFGGGGGGCGLNNSVAGGDGGNASPNGSFIGGSQSGGNGGGGAGDSQNGYSATGIDGTGIPGNGGSGIGVDLLFGGGGGGGGASESGYPGGSGVGAAGGGGGGMLLGGSGGILGGGGGAGLSQGGEGGFGAGGGGAVIGGTGGGGFGAAGGDGASDPSGVTGGGGGSGLGGAIFVQSNANLFIVDALQISGNTAIAGIGGTSNQTGVPQAGNGAALGYDIFLREQGSITFDLSNTLTIPTPIEGDQTNGPDTTGGLQKLGMGTLKLNGANTYSGTTSVLEGNLNLNGSLFGSTLVGPGGRFSGNATVSGNLMSSGILSPGNSIGTINTTNLMLTPSSLLEMEMAANGTNDLIAATGTAQIDGTLDVILLPGNFQTVQSYTIITAAGGRTGTFSTIESNEPSLIEVIYDPNAVIVEVLPITAIGMDCNAQAAASCYLADGFAIGSDVEAISAALLTLDVSGIADSFDQMQPSYFSGLAWSQIENALLVRSSYSQHLERVNLNCNCCNTPSIWVEAIGAWQKQNSHGEQVGYNDWTVGATVGIDAICCDEFSLGVAGSYTHSSLDWNKSIGHANINSYYGGLYTNWSNGFGYINATLLAAYSHYKTDRHLHFATIDRHAKSSHNSWEGLAGFEAGLNLAWSECMEVTPFARIDYIHLSRKGFVEDGASSLDLRVDSKQDQIIQSEFGFVLLGRYNYENGCGPGALVPRFKLSYINDAPLQNRHLNARFAGSDCNFRVQGMSFQRNFAATSLGLTYLNCNETLRVTLRYDGQFGQNYYLQAANIAVDFNF